MIEIETIKGIETGIEIETAIDHFIQEPRAHFDDQSNSAKTNDHSGSVHNAGGWVLLDSVAIHRHNAECEVTTRKGSSCRRAARNIDP